ncbi:hypothetical protein HK405_012403, partial [Cladochytrium tenue]
AVSGMSDVDLFRDGLPSLLSEAPAAGGVTFDDLSKETHIVVCTHGAFDCRCGDKGGELYEQLVKEVRERNLAHVKLHKTTHIGGHAFAANAIVYPSGDWYGLLGASDAAPLLDAVTSKEVLWSHWRGRHTFDQERQQRAAQERRMPEFVTVTYVLADGSRVRQRSELFDNPSPESGLGPYRETCGGGSGSGPAAPAPGGVPKSASAPAPAAAAETVAISFVLPDGSRKEFGVPVGAKLMEFARDHDLPGIEGVCGGNLECATCHVI